MNNFADQFLESTSFFRCNHVIKQNDFDKYANTKKSHYHDHYEVFYFLGDTMTYFVDNRSITLNKYDIILIPPNIYHRSTYFDGVKQERLVISFSIDFLDFFNNDKTKLDIIKIFDRHWLRVADTSIMAKIFATMKNIIQANDSEKSTGLLRARLMLYEMLLYLTEIISYIPYENNREILLPIEKNIHDIVSYINNNYMENLTLNNIAERFYISKYYLCRAFKNIIGMGVTEFVNSKRIVEVAALLQRTNKSISEVSSSVGFRSQAFFIQLFKRTYGMTPSDYRRNHQ